MYHVYYLNVSSVYMSGDVQYGRMIQGCFDTLEEAEERKAFLIKRRGYKPDKIIIEKVLK